MARINLLPWRAERRKQREREFYVMLGLAAVAGVLAFLGVMLQFDNMIENQSRRNTFLDQQIVELDKKIEEIKELEKTRSKLLARKSIIEQLQASRSQMVHLFDELVRTIPEGVRLINIKQTGNLLELQGSAQSNARVSAYLRSLDGSQWLNNPDLSKIEADDKDKKSRYNFSLKVNLRKAEGEQEKDEAFPDQGATP